MQFYASFQGSTHRLEIHPPSHSRGKNVSGGGGGEGEEEREHTTLRMSDLGEDEGREGEGRGEVKNVTDGQNDFEGRIQSLQNEVDALTARLEQEQLHHVVPLTRSRLLRHNTFTPSESRDPLLGDTALLTSSRLQEQTHKREELVNTLEEVERESNAVSRHMDQLQYSVKKLATVRDTIWYQTFHME